MPRLTRTLKTIGNGKLAKPHALLGPQITGKSWTLRCWQPQAQAVELLDGDDNLLMRMERVQPEGLFEVKLPLPVIAYRLRLLENNQQPIIDDPYRFASIITEQQHQSMRDGELLRLDRLLGAHATQIDGIDGVNFAVWAPHASRLCVVGQFNDWDGRRHPMRLNSVSGVWDLFIPGLKLGEFYKFKLLDAAGKSLPLKADPFARSMELAPGNASIVYDDAYQWHDANWLAQKRTQNSFEQPISIYEVHLGSWRRQGDNHQMLSYRELAGELVAYVTQMGYTHIELLPISEHPFNGSWGYQPIGMFAPTARFGSPQDFKFFVDCCHQQGIGLIMDWVPAHFPRDEHGLGQFDGSHLYEHADPRKGSHPDWGTLIFNFSHVQVVNYLIANALYWIEEFHIDALRVDAVASMLYLDYSRQKGEWLPNEDGGNENFEAVAFLQQLNEKVHACGAITMAEESTAWPGVSLPVYAGGLGFSYKWNMGWMHDSLAYFREPPANRRLHQDKLTFGLMYAFSENFILPLSHDEVVHGKGSMINRMPGDDDQPFANLRLHYAFMYAYPGKKLLFMGCEFAQKREWNHDDSLDWALLEQAEHAGVQNLVRDLNRLYRDTPSLHQQDCKAAGFEWIDFNDQDNTVISFLRRGLEPTQLAIIVCNMTSLIHQHYRIGVPTSGLYRELINSDAAVYGGSSVGNLREIQSEAKSQHGHSDSITLDLPPLSILILALS